MKMSNEHFILQILNTVTKGYATKVCLIKEQLDRGKTVAIDNVKDCLSLEYERVLKRKNKYKDDNKSDKEGEKAFAATHFKGQCNYCGKYATNQPIATKESKITTVKMTIIIKIISLIIIIIMDSMEKQIAERRRQIKRMQVFP